MKEMDLSPPSMMPFSLAIGGPVSFPTLIVWHSTPILTYASALSQTPRCRLIKKLLVAIGVLA